MAISAGDTLPAAKLFEATPQGPKETSVDDVFGGKTVALFAVPGAFTPTCHKNHLPSFLNNMDALKTKGVDVIACVSVNDAFVMSAWAEAAGATGKITMLADGNADFTKAIGMELDGSGFGMGTRSKRYAMLVENKVVKIVNAEDGAGFDVSSAEHLLKGM